MRRFFDVVPRKGWIKIISLVDSSHVISGEVGIRKTSSLFTFTITVAAHRLVQKLLFGLWSTAKYVFSISISQTAGFTYGPRWSLDVVSGILFETKLLGLGYLVVDSHSTRVETFRLIY